MDRPRFENHRDHADVIVRAVLDAAEPGACVRRHWPESMRNSNGPCVVIAFGKASVAMAGAAAELLGDRMIKGVVAAPRSLGAEQLDPRFEVFECDHPLPSEQNLAAAQAVERCVCGAPSDGLVVVCISGGGSAYLTMPVEGVALADVVEITDALLRAGALIDELNCVRKHVERLKGGGVARLAGARRVVSLIMSDVVGDRLDVIASGPTVPDPTTFEDSLGVLHRRDVIPPVGVRAVLESGAAGDRAETPKPGDPAFESGEQCVVGSNRLAVEAAASVAESLGFRISAVEHDRIGEASDLGRELARRTSVPPACVVVGGETTVTVGDAAGVGGRNHELALAAAFELQSRPMTAMLAFATDGVDGLSPSAGAVVTSETIAGMHEAQIDPVRALSEHDGFTALDAVGASIRTGATGTNVNDVAVLLAY